MYTLHSEIHSNSDQVQHWDCTSAITLMVEKMVKMNGVRFRGYANNDKCAPRYFNGNNSAMNTNRNFAASAQV